MKTTSPTPRRATFAFATEGSNDDGVDEGATDCVHRRAGAPPVRADNEPVNDLLASMRKRIETADFRATGHLVWVQPNGARLSYPITIKAHWFPGVLREWVEIGDASKSGDGPARSSTSGSHLLLEMRPNGQSSIYDRAYRRQICRPRCHSKDGATARWARISATKISSSSSTSGRGKPRRAMLNSARAIASSSKARPGASDRTHYAQVKTWLDPSIGFPVYVEKTDKADRRGEGVHLLRHSSRGRRLVGAPGRSEGPRPIRLHAAHHRPRQRQGKSHAGDFSPAQLTHF